MPRTGMNGGAHAAQFVLPTGALLLLPYLRTVKAGVPASGSVTGHGILRYGDEAGPGG